MARDLREMIQILADKGDEVYSKICRVERVDEARRIIDATPIVGGATIPEVRLQPVENRKEGLIFVPKVGSFVMVTFFAVYDAYVAMGTEFEKVLLDMGGVHLEILNPEEDGKESINLTLNGAAVNIGQNDQGKTKVRIDCEKEFKEDGVSAVPSIIFNGGENEGLVIAKELYNQLKGLQDWCKDHTHEFNISAPPGTAGGFCKGSIYKVSEEPNIANLERLQNKHIEH